MLSKRIIACLDVRDGQVVKGINFEGLRSAGDPAALAQRYNLDSRDEGNAQRQELIWSDEGIWDCTFVGECSEVCPKHVDPAGAIQQAKVEATNSFFISLLPFTPPGIGR